MSSSHNMNGGGQHGSHHTNGHNIPTSASPDAKARMASPDGQETPTKRSRLDSGPTYPLRSSTNSTSTPLTSSISSTYSNSQPSSLVSTDSTATIPFHSTPASPTPPIRTCLLVIDVQNDFTTGSLKAPDALGVIPLINQLRVKYMWDLVVFTRDAHPTDHVSFYINHASDPKAQLFQPYQLPSGHVQVLWPVHCVTDTWGYELHNDLIKDPQHDVIIDKGVEQDHEFYSAFISTDGIHRTNLSDILHQHGITHVATCGLVYEYCVGNSAIDAAHEGFQTAVVTDATRGLTNEGVTAMKTKMEEAGVAIIPSQQLAQHGFKPKPSIQVQPLRSISTLASHPTPARSPTATSSRHQQHPQVQQHYANAAAAATPRQFASHLHRAPSASPEYNLPPLSPLSTPTTSSCSSVSATPRFQSPAHSRNISQHSSNASITQNNTNTSSPRPRLLLGLSGSVASIKVADLLHLLCQWAEVRVICTGKSQHFFNVTEIQQQFGAIVYQDEDEWKPWKRGDTVLHVELRKWADLMLVAPLSANTLAKISNGLCDNLLTTVIRCWDFATHPLILAPAMNTVMWDSPFTRQQLGLLSSLGVQTIQPIDKKLACGDIGKGAMADVNQIDATCAQIWTSALDAGYQQATPMQQDSPAEPVNTKANYHQPSATAHTPTSLTQSQLTQKQHGYLHSTKAPTNSPKFF